MPSSPAGRTTGGAAPPVAVGDTGSNSLSTPGPGSKGTDAQSVEY
jgi:hypothetical protein